MSSANPTLEELLIQRVSLFANSERPAEIIDEHTEQMFKSVVEELFRSYGGMGKAVKQAVNDALPENISKQFELTKYNRLVSNALKKKWEESAVSDEVVAMASNSIDEVIAGLVMPETVSLSALIESFIDSHKEEAFESGWESPDIRIHQSELGTGSTFYHIYFSKEPESSESRHSKRTKFGLDNNIAVSVRNDETNDGSPIGEVYAGMINGDVLGRKFSPSYGDYEKLITALYYGDSKLIIDCDADDFVYPGYD